MRIFSVLVLLGLLLCGCNRKHSTGAQTRPDAQDSFESGPMNAHNRPVYPYSVIAGGIQSPEELEAAIQTDPVVARHYSRIDVHSLKPVRLDHDAFAYVSYRVHEKVYWTSHKVKLTAGETVLESDGTGVDGVRGRCGNQVSFEPRSPVADSKFEPAGAELDTPVSWETADRQVQPDAPIPVPAVLPEVTQSKSRGIASPPAAGTAFAPSGKGISGIAGGGTFPSGSGAPGSAPAQPTIPSPPTVGPIIPPVPIIATWPVMPASTPPSIPIVQTIPVGPGPVPVIVVLPGQTVTAPSSDPSKPAPIVIPIDTSSLPTGGDRSISYSPTPAGQPPPAESFSSGSTFSVVQSQAAAQTPEPSTYQMLIVGTAFIGLMFKLMGNSTRRIG